MDFFSGLSVCGTISVGRGWCGLGYISGLGRIGGAGTPDTVVQACGIYQGTGAAAAL